MPATDSPQTEIILPDQIESGDTAVNTLVPIIADEGHIIVGTSDPVTNEDRGGSSFRVWVDTDLTGEDLSAIDSLIVDDGTDASITATLTAEQVSALGWNITTGKGDRIDVVDASGDLTGLSLYPIDDLSLNGDIRLTPSQLDGFSGGYSGSITKNGYTVELDVQWQGESDLSWLNISAADSLVVDDGTDDSAIAILTAAQMHALAGHIRTGTNDHAVVRDTIANLAEAGLPPVAGLYVQDSLDNVLADSSGVVANATRVNARLWTDADLTGTDITAIYSLAVDDGTEASITATMTHEQLSALGWNITTGKGDRLAIADASGDLTALNLYQIASISLGGDVSIHADQVYNFINLIGGITKNGYTVELAVDSWSNLSHANISALDSLTVDDGTDGTATAILTAAQMDALAGHIRTGTNDHVVTQDTIANLAASRLAMNDMVYVFDSLDNILADTSGIVANAARLTAMVGTDADLTDEDISAIDSLLVSDETEASITATLTIEQLSSLAGNISTGKGDHIAISDAAGDLTGLTGVNLYGVNSISLGGNVSMTDFQLIYFANAITKNGYTVELDVQWESDLRWMDISAVDSLQVDDGSDASITAILNASQAAALSGRQISTGANDQVVVRDSITNINTRPGLPDDFEVRATDTVANLTGASLALVDEVYIDDTLGNILADNSGVVANATWVTARIGADADLTGMDLSAIDYLLTDNGAAGMPITVTMTPEQISALWENITTGTRNDGNTIAFATASDDLAGLHLDHADNMSLEGDISMTPDQLSRVTIAKNGYSVELNVDSWSDLRWQDITTVDTMVVDDGTDGATNVILTQEQYDMLGGENITLGTNDTVLLLPAEDPEYLSALWGTTDWGISLDAM